MKKFVLWVLWIAVALAIVVIGGGYVLPDKAHVERQIAINAPPEKVFAIVADLRRSGEWSPWFAIDPQMTVTHEGAGPGLGQKMTWSSTHKDVGSGSQTTVEYVDNQKIVAALDFGEMGKATAAMTLAPQAGGTQLTWDFNSELNGIMERWFGLMFDRWIGADYEKGLANLKALAEKQS